jgi:DNA-binding NarL/FixJ family response regulator
VQTVVRRFMDDNEGKLVRLVPERNAGRYRFGNPYILRVLEVTAAEQRQLQTVISGDEKRRRLTDKRRASGIMSREQYRDRAAQRAIEARELRSEGLSVREVAERLGVTERAARGYLRG